MFVLACEKRLALLEASERRQTACLDWLVALRFAEAGFALFNKRRWAALLSKRLTCFSYGWRLLLGGVALA